MDLVPNFSFKYEWNRQAVYVYVTEYLDRKSYVFNDFINSERMNHTEIISGN